MLPERGVGGPACYRRRMGLFDRLANLGKGWVSLKRSPSDATTAEAEAEIAGAERPTVAPTPRPQPTKGDSHGDDEPTPKVIKRL